jgi:putative transposase
MVAGTGQHSTLNQQASTSSLSKGATTATPVGSRGTSVRYNVTMIYRGFPAPLHHAVPDWVEIGALFHIRIAVDREKQRTEVTADSIAGSLLGSAKFYEANQRWHITVFSLMPDHLHALLSFPRGEAMSRIIGEWKHFQAREHGIIWQEGYFDPRLGEDERGEQLSTKISYIRQNSVAAG